MRHFMSKSEVLAERKDDGDNVTARDLRYIRNFRDAILLSDGSQLYATRRGAVWRYFVSCYSFGGCRCGRN